VPDGGFAEVIAIDESPIWTLTGVLIVCCGVDESLAVTETEYVPAVAGIPDNCPVLLSTRLEAAARIRSNLAAECRPTPRTGNPDKRRRSSLWEERLR